MTPEQMRDASLLELFSLEAEAQTQVLSAGLLALERDPTQADHLESCMRAAHSLKGAARIVGVDAGVSVAHVMEDCLVSAQEGRLYLRPEHIDALLQGTDLLMRIATPDNNPDSADIEAYVALMARCSIRWRWPRRSAPDRAVHGRRIRCATRSSDEPAPVVEPPPAHPEPRKRPDAPPKRRASPAGHGRPFEQPARPVEQIAGGNPAAQAAPGHHATPQAHAEQRPAGPGKPQRPSQGARLEPGGPGGPRRCPSAVGRIPAIAGGKERRTG